MRSSEIEYRSRKGCGLVIAGTQSSSGKTLVNAMVLASLKRRGLDCQPFKTGPDYIDAAYSGRYADTPCYNLDFWLMDPESIRALAYEKTSNAIGVVEGVMGLLDGISPDSSEGSTLSVAQTLNWPVFLVLPAAKQGRSIRATVRGFIEEAGEGVIQGLILNKVSGASHAQYIERAVADLGIPVVGAIPSLPDVAWPERDLGLQASQEWVPTPADRLCEIANDFLDLDQMLEIAARNSNPQTENVRETVEPAQQWAKGKRLAIAQDEAFHFYYQGNFDALEAWGFEWIPFSPMQDACLPEGIDGLILGGGFPEVYAGNLANNTSMRNSIHRAIQARLPCYAECGGFMYLCEGIVQTDGSADSMVGVIPGSIHMTDCLQHFGYSECVPEWIQNGFRAHEFHYSYWDKATELANLWEVKKPSRSTTRMEGYRLPKLHASYLHLYYPTAEPLFKRLFA